MGPERPVPWKAGCPKAPPTLQVLTVRLGGARRLGRSAGCGAPGRRTLHGPPRLQTVAGAREPAAAAQCGLSARATAPKGHGITMGLYRRRFAPQHNRQGAAPRPATGRVRVAAELTPQTPGKPQLCEEMGPDVPSWGTAVTSVVPSLFALLPGLGQQPHSQLRAHLPLPLGPAILLP